MGQTGVMRARTASPARPPPLVASTRPYSDSIVLYRIIVHYSTYAYDSVLCYSMPGRRGQEPEPRRPQRQAGGLDNNDSNNNDNNSNNDDVIIVLFEIIMILIMSSNK